MVTKRKKTREVDVGGVKIGGGNPIPVQTMWPEKVTMQDIPRVVRHIEILKQYGCSLLRFTVTSEDDLTVLAELNRRKIMPLVADIHYDHTLAVHAVQKGILKVRINPGTIGGSAKTREVIRAAKGEGCAVRLGLNTGSLPKRFSSPDAVKNILDAADEYIELFEQEGFKDLVVSLKSSDPDATCRANRAFSNKYDYPLHIGVTEAGPLIPSVVKSTFALSELLKNGIGDTIRVSITDSMEHEIIAGREILRLFDLLPEGVNIISCPKCGRATFDTHAFLRSCEHRLYQIRKSVTVAFMGCSVNGIEEARHADIGITGAGKKIVIFKRGTVVREVTFEQAEEALFQELDKL